ncbi:hypothetical protein C2E23DRAFT_849192, partial [Lenzites betulinus]
VSPLSSPHLALSVCWLSGLGFLWVLTLGMALSSLVWSTHSSASHCSSPAPPAPTASSASLAAFICSSLICCLCSRCNTCQ